jgi:hypothetical protein
LRIDRWRILLAVAAAACVGACAQDPYTTLMRPAHSGDWEIETLPDRITGRPLSHAYLLTYAAETSDSVVQQTGTLQLYCLKEQPVVRIGFPFKIGSTPDATLAYRFDDKPGHEALPVRFLRGSQIVVIEDRKEIARFVSEMEASKVLYVRTRSLNHHRASAFYRVEGAGPAIAAAFAECPLAPLQRRASQ